MKCGPTLTVMLTYNDMTVCNAHEIFEKCKNSSAEYWGFKEEPLARDEMKKLFAYMKECGKKTVLEVVCYDEKIRWQARMSRRSADAIILWARSFLTR